MILEKKYEALCVMSDVNNISDNKIWINISYVINKN